MSEHIHHFFINDSPQNHFHQIIALHEVIDLEWDVIHKLAPLLPRGWYELSRLDVADRIEFTYGFWQSKFSFISNASKKFEKSLEDFFSELDDIGIFAVQSKQDGPFDVHMVYTQKGGSFFQGAPPATDEVIELLIKRFGHLQLPSDYLAFLTIHDGFSKYTDTGLIRSRDLAPVYQKLQRLLAGEALFLPDGDPVNSECLIPFYESFGLHCYQCFYSDWCPGHEMGNIYFSEYDRSLSNFLDSKALEENLAFSTFMGWLIFYLEDILPN